MSDFHASWDLMEVTTESNLICLALEISGRSFDSPVVITETEFEATVDAIFDIMVSDRLRTNDHGVDNKNNDNDEVFDFHLGTI